MQTVPPIEADSTPYIPSPDHLPHGDENLSPLAQLRRMQRVLFADVMAEDTDKRIRAMIACAWEKLEGRKAVLTMKAPPKPVDTLELKRQRDKARAAKTVSASQSWRSKPKAAQAPAPAPVAPETPSATQPN